MDKTIDTEEKEWLNQKTTIELTNDERTKIEMYLLMTTQYREEQRKTWEDIAKETDENGNIKYKNAESNKIFWEQQIEAVNVFLEKLKA